jgi:hypothetical protein
MASFSIKDGNSTKNNAWSIEPMVFKLYNARGEGDYPTGLIPDVTIDELSEPLLPLGEPDDPLISEALGRINGRSRLARANKAIADNRPQILYDSRTATDKHTNFIITP